MSDFWAGAPRLARPALVRLMQGKPMFGRPALDAKMRASRRQAVTFLYDTWLVERGPRGPVPTPDAAEMLAPPKREQELTDKQRATLAKLFGIVPVDGLSERYGLKPTRIYEIATEMR